MAPMVLDSLVTVVFCKILMVVAGWGGAIVALTTKQDADKIIQGLIKEYYEDIDGMTEEGIARAVFATQPGSGASIYLVEQNGIH